MASRANTGFWVEAAIGAALLAVGVAVACNTSSNTSAATCSSVCSSQLPCSDTLNQCLSWCGGLEARCTGSGRPSTFEAYLDCASDAGFSCADGGLPVANAPCGPIENQLVVCQSEVDGGFTLPDGSIAADNLCAHSTACASCCQMHHTAGAKAFSQAVEACACGDAGACRAKCTNECAAWNKVDAGPAPNDLCDICLTSALDDQASPPGPCVVPVTASCNKTLDCALYANCVSQSGCTN